MKKYKKYNKKGFTLVELLIAIALITVVIIVSMNMFFFGTNAHRLTFKEYEIQSDVRIATEQVTNIVRYSKAVFGVPYPFVESTSKMDPGWSYFMVSPDGKRIVSMDYNDTTKVHEEKIIVEEQDNIEYEMIFEKDKNAKNDNVMIYKIYAQVVDENGNKVRDKIVFESKVESVNAVQVADKGTAAAPSIALAYRNDGQTSGKGKNEIAYITIITDVSGSMAERPDGNNANDNSTDATKHSRIKLVKEALAGQEKGTVLVKEGIIQRFAKEENVFVSLIPFSTTANAPDPMNNSKPDARHDIYEVFDAEQSKTLQEKAKALKAFGGTNTGDALRQAYHLHNDFRDRMKATIKPEDQVHHYMILLVDGQTTYQTKYQEWEDVQTRYTSKNLYGEIWIDLGWGWGYYDYGKIGEYEVWNPKEKRVSSLSDFTGEGNFNQNNTDFSYRYPETVVTNPVVGGKYGAKFPNTIVVGRTGDGSTTISNASSIKTMGNLIKSFDGGNGIGSYLIGYAGGLDGEIGYIADSIGTPENIVNSQDSEQNKTYRYLYNNKDFDVSDILKQIANDILADFWLATGPQIQ